MASLEKSVSRAFPVSVRERLTRPDAQSINLLNLPWPAAIQDWRGSLQYWRNGRWGGMSSTIGAPCFLQILLVVLILRPWQER